MEIKALNIENTFVVDKMAQLGIGNQHSTY